jgi:hypothetical protein
MANVTILFYVVPAFKRTKNRAFLWIACASLLGTFDTVCDYTIGIGSYRRGHPEYVTYRTFRKFTYFADCIFAATGVVLLARDAIKVSQSNSSEDNDRDA